jgi:hypothetical protein
LKATFLQGIKIASYSGRVSHARLDAANPEKYLYIMRDSIDAGLGPLSLLGLTNGILMDALSLSFLLMSKSHGFFTQRINVRESAILRSDY